MILPLLALLQSAPPPVQIDSIPRITLNEALQRAVRLNPDYVQALGFVSEAEWSRTAARLAFFLPAVSVELDGTKYSTEFFNIGTGTLQSSAVTFRADGRYDIFRVRKFTDLARTSAELEAATATELQRRYAAALLIESAYYSVLAETEFTRVARERLGRASEQLDVSRARVSTGAAVQTDSLQTRLEFTRARVLLRIQETSLTVAQMELGRRAGIAGPADAEPLDTLPAPDLPITLPEAIARALDQGPEYRVARANERAAESALKGERGQYLPVVFLAGNYSRFDDHYFPAGAMSGPSRWASACQSGTTVSASSRSNRRGPIATLPER